MASHTVWGMTPRQSIELAVRQHGRDPVIQGCAALLAGDDADPWLVRVLGGPNAARVLDAAEEQRYWLKVWGARGLLWIWDAQAADVVVAALCDDAWRVREMAAKVVARHRIDAAHQDLLALQLDSNSRVRAAAGRALQRLALSGA